MARDAVSDEGVGTPPGERLQAYRLRLRVSGIRCASERVPLERALQRLEGVRAVSVSSLLEQVWLVLDSLVPLERILRLIVKRGYSVDLGDVRLTMRLPGPPALSDALDLDLSSLPWVTGCRLERSTGRVELELAFAGEWEEAVSQVKSLADCLAIGSELWRLDG